MIFLCPKRNRCVNYKKQTPCWGDLSKGKIIHCSDYVRKT